MADPQVGATASASLVVGSADLASALGLEPGETFPPVFSTIRLVTLVELASARLLRPLLGPGEMSVGVRVDVEHTAATAEGAEVRAMARYLGREGKLFVFEVEAFDPGGRIGRGTHKRAVVSEERLRSGAVRRSAAS